jgi:hypothetical protein
MNALEIGGLQAEVVAVQAKGYPSGAVVSIWDARRIAADAEEILKGVQV